jgi:hypothetical protein
MKAQLSPVGFDSNQPIFLLLVFDQLRKGPSHGNCKESNG